jgi:hypothetical protein
MAASTTRWNAMLLMVVMASALSTSAGTLQFDFYKDKCPGAEDVIRSTTQKLIASDPTIGAALVRLFFHDCFVRVISRPYSSSWVKVNQNGKEPRTQHTNKYVNTNLISFRAATPPFCWTRPTATRSQRS